MRVLIYMLPELGHLYPTFSLARALEQAGHEVVYASVLDFEPAIREQGFRCVAVHRGAYPRGAIPAIDALGPNERDLANHRINNQFLDDVLSGGLEDCLREVSPDVVLADVIRPHVTFVAHALGIPSARLSSSLSQRLDELPPINSAMMPDELPLALEAMRRKNSVHPWTNVNGVRELDLLSARYAYPQSEISLATAFVPELTRYPEMVLCASAFDFPRSASEKRIFLATPVDTARPENVPPEVASFVDEEHPLVYGSLGSQSLRYWFTPAFFEAFLRALDARRALKGILVAGDKFAELASIAPPNVLVLRRAPQLWALRRASMFVTHAGLGSIREAIALRVPMIAIPQAYDQPGNAARVVHHGIGLQIPPTILDADLLGRGIDRVLRDADRFGARLASIDEACKREEAESHVPTRIAELVGRSPRAPAVPTTVRAQTPASVDTESGWLFLDSNQALRGGKRLAPGDTVREEGPEAPARGVSGFMIYRSLVKALIYAEGSTLARVRISGDVTSTSDGAVGREIHCSWTLDLETALAELVTTWAETYLAPERELAPEIAAWCIDVIRACRARVASRQASLGDIVNTWRQCCGKAADVSHRAFEIVAAAGCPAVFESARLTYLIMLFAAARSAAGDAAGTAEGAARFQEAQREVTARVEADLAARVERLRTAG